MKLFKKVLLNLFKIVLALTIAIVSFTVDMLILLEDVLQRLRTKLYYRLFVTNEQYMNQLKKEHKKENSRKIVNVD